MRTLILDKGQTTIEDRVALAKAALADRAEDLANDPEAAIQDMISDLLHLARVSGVGTHPEAILRFALRNMEAEVAAANAAPRGNLVSLTGAIATARIETIRAQANIDSVSLNADETYTIEYTGDSDIDWDSQCPLEDADGAQIYVMDNGLSTSERLLLWVREDAPTLGSLPKLDVTSAFRFLTSFGKANIANQMKGKLMVTGRNKGRKVVLEDCCIALAKAKSGYFRKANEIIRKHLWSIADERKNTNADS